MKKITVKNQGYALVTALVFLLVLTLIGVTAMRSTTLEERMMANMRDLSVAFQASESALRDAEGWLALQTAKDVGSDPPGAGDNVWTLDASLDGGLLEGMVNWDISDWDDDATQYPVLPPGTQTLTGVDTQPYYVIQYTTFDPDTTDIGKANPPPGVDYYRITTRGSGLSDQSVTIIQGSYAKRFN